MSVHSPKRRFALSIGIAAHRFPNVAENCDRWVCGDGCSPCLHSARLAAGSQLAKDASGAAFFAQRGKTGKPVGGSLNDRALVAMHAHLERLGIELHGDAYIFHNRSGAPYSSDTLGDDFRAVRIAVFGESDKRTLADFRRSGAHEAIAGEATPAE